MDPTADLSIRDLADLEDRQQRGEKLSDDDAAALAAARRKVKSIAGGFRPPLTRSVVASNPEALQAFKRTTKAITGNISAIVNHWAETYREENAWVDSWPPGKRKHYEHMTMPEIRREMRRSPASVRPMARRREHVSSRRPRRSAARRAAGVRSGNDPGDDGPEPALALAPPPKARYLYAVLTPEQRGGTS